MPEIAEVARIVHFLKKYVVGKTLSSVVALEDTIVYKDTTSELFKKAMEGKKVVDVKQLGKYFWLVMDSSPHPLMHFGMTGWVVFQKDPTTHYRSNGEEKEQAWPPRFVKFILSTEKGNDIAFVDARRLARIRLIDEPTGDIRNLAPLKENGPDPVIDGIDEKWFAGVVRKKKVPVKAFLLDQKTISGVGNWVGDEILYHARIHPEQYCNTLTDAQVKELHKQLLFVTTTAVKVNGESAKFPTDWLFLYRWGKGKSKKENVLPNGEKIDYVTVGGRTSAYVKTRQKATGHTAVVESKKRDKEEDEEEVKSEDEGEQPAKKSKTTKAAAAKKESTPKKVPSKKMKKEEEEHSETEEKPAKKTEAAAAKKESKPQKASSKKPEKEDEDAKADPIEKAEAKKAAKNSAKADKKTLMTDAPIKDSPTRKSSTLRK